MIRINNWVKRTYTDVPPVTEKPDAPYTNTINGYPQISAFTPTAPGVTFANFKGLDDRYYFAAMGRKVFNRDPFCFQYNQYSNQIDQTTRVPIGVIPYLSDTHRVPSLEYDSSGNIYMVCEKLSATTGHGTDILVYKTTVPYNLSSLTLIKTLPGTFTYPIIKVNGSNVFVCARGRPNTSTFINHEEWYYTSTDGGLNFSAPVLLYDSGDPFVKISYVWAMYDYTAGNLCIILNERDNVIGNWTFVSLIKGVIGSNVWTNASGSFSKNVSSSGAITRAQMLSSCLVYESTNYSTIAVNHESGCIKSDGTINLLISIQTLTGEEYLGNPESQLDEIRSYRFSGGSWSYNTIPELTDMIYFWAYQHYIIYLNNDSANDHVLIIDPNNNHDVSILESSNNFSSYSKTLKLIGNNNYRLGSICYNVASINDQMIVLVDTQGDPLVINDETTADYSNLVLLVPNN
jgi:hypothetical protein